MRTAVLCCAIAFACVANGRAVQAQRISPLSLDAGVGMIHRGGNVYASETGYVLEAMGAARLGSALGGSTLLAASGGFDVFPDNDSCMLLPNGGCRSGAGLGHASLLVGWQTGSTFAFRVLGGVAYYGEDTGNASAAGLEGRIDLGVPLFPHLAFAVSSRAALLPNVRDGSVTMFAATIGVRLH